MLLLERVESKELAILKLLNLRMKIPDDAKKRLFSLQQGYEGELKFDKFSAVLCEKLLILRGLFLEHDGNKFQIDTLVIAQKCMIVCENKYYQGNYYYQEGEFRNCITKKETNNPLHQLSRCKMLLSQLLQKHGLPLTIDGYVIFNHPEFFLYNAPQNEPIIFLPQMNKLLSNLCALPSVLNDGHHRIAQILLDKHNPNPPFTLSFSYDFDGLQKGPFCAHCSSFLVSSSGRKLVCNCCGHKEDLSSAVMRGVEEIRLLFPEMKITTNLVYEWCQLGCGKREIRRLLKKNFILMGYGKYSYYLKK